MITALWRQALADALATGADDGWKCADFASTLTVRPVAAQTSAVLFARDDTMQDWFSEVSTYGVPDHVSYVYCARFPLQHHLRVHETQAQAVRRPALWVGGASVRDLVHFALLRSGGVDAAQDERGLAVTYRGVDDAWLAGAAESVKQGSDGLVSSSSRWDRSVWDTMRTLGIDWEELLGKRIVSLLDGGKEVTLFSVARRGKFSKAFIQETYARVFRP